MGRTLEEDGERADRQRPELWKQSREQTAMTRAELATVLHAITGDRYDDPRWPDTMDDLRAAIRAA